MSDRKLSANQRALVALAGEQSTQRRALEKELIPQYRDYKANEGDPLAFRENLPSDDHRAVFDDCVEIDGEFTGHGKAVLKKVMGDPLPFPPPPPSLGERILRHHAGEAPTSPNLAAPPNLGELILRHAGVK